jgi:hypothetical protein
MIAYCTMAICRVGSVSGVRTLMLQVWLSYGDDNHWLEQKITQEDCVVFPYDSMPKEIICEQKIAELMRWHAEKRVNDGKLRHLADGS